MIWGEFFSIFKLLKVNLI